MRIKDGWVFLTVVACATAGCSPAAAPPPTDLTAADSAALRAVAERDAPLVLSRDWATLSGAYTETAVRMPPNGPAIHGPAAIRASLEQMPPVKAFTFRLVDFHGSGDLAYMHGAWTIALTPPGAKPVADSGKILVVLRKQSDGSWKRVADAWNSDLPPGR